MDNWSFDEESKSGVLVVGGEMTIGYVSDLKEQLVEAFHNAENVTLDVSETTSVDVAGLQLLCACHRYSSKQGKTMKLNASRNERFVVFLEEVGFSQEFFCSQGNAEECLWSSLD